MKIIEIKVKDKYWLMSYTAITLYPFIFYKKSEFGNVLRRHEWQHIKQIRYKGWLRFHLDYLRQYLLVGYDKVTYEVEAYKLQYDGQKPWERKDEK